MSKIGDKIPDKGHDATKEEFEEILKVIVANKSKNGWKDEYETFLRMRWWKAVLHLQYSATKYQRLYFISSGLVLILSAIITAMSAANNFAGEYLGICGASSATLFRMLLFVFSLIVTITVGLGELFKFNEVFRKKRRYAEILKAEGFRFLQLTANYSSSKHSYCEVFPKFAANVEEILNKVNEEYISLFDKKTQ